MKSLFSIVLILSAACATVVTERPTARETSEILIPSEIHRLRQKFDGEIVTVRGWLISGHDERGLWNNEADHDKNRIERCISIAVPRSMDDEITSMSNREVVLTGRFHSDVKNLAPAIFLGLCNTSILELLIEFPPRARTAGS